MNATRVRVVSWLPWFSSGVGCRIDAFIKVLVVGAARWGRQSSLRRRRRHDEVRGVLAGVVNQKGRPRQVGVMTCTTSTDQEDLGVLG
jgi:hypothetical protein